MFYVLQFAVLVGIRQDTIWFQRGKSLGGRLHRYGSVETEFLREKRFRAIQPANQAEDPYIAAVLIALAQYQRDEVRWRELERRELRARRKKARTEAVGVEQSEASSSAAGTFLVCPWRLRSVLGSPLNNSLTRFTCWSFRLRGKSSFTFTRPRFPRRFWTSSRLLRVLFRVARSRFDTLSCHWRTRKYW